MQMFDEKVCRKIVEMTAQELKLRCVTFRDQRAATATNIMISVAIGSSEKLWADMVECLHAATNSLEERSYGSIDPVNTTYDGPNSNIIVKNADSLLQDLQRIDSLVAIARNIMAAGEKAQNLAAQVGFDRETCALIHLCIKITARGYDGDGANVEEDRWQAVVNGFKKLLITCLQFLSNLSTDNERLRLLLWVELFDSNADHQTSPNIKNFDAPDALNTTSDEWLAQAAARIAEAQRMEVVPASPFAHIQQHLQSWAAADLQGPKATMAAYLIFVETRRDQVSRELNAQGIDDPHATMQELQRQWKAMPEDDQAQWVSQYKDRIAQYESLIEMVASQTQNASALPTASDNTGSSQPQQAHAADGRAGTTTPYAERPPMSRSTSSYSRQQQPRNHATPPSLAAVESNVMETAYEGKMKLAEGKAQLMKRLGNVPADRNRAPSTIPPDSPLEMPEVPHPAPDGEGNTLVNELDPAIGDDEEDEGVDEGDDEEEEEEEDEEEEDEEEEEEYDEDEESEEEEEEDEDESSEDEYAIPGEDGRGLLTDVPLILGPNEIEVLPMIIMSGLVPKKGESLAPVRTTDGKPTMNMYTIRCHLLLAQENGRNLLRELLIFVAAWDLREEELYFKFMFKITEAILMNGLMPFAYGAFKEQVAPLSTVALNTDCSTFRSKDVISPAQAVIMKLLTKIFHSRTAYISVPRYSSPRANIGREVGDPVRYDIAIVRYLFAEFRQHIIPQICSLIFLQGQIHRGKAAVEDFPLNLWDMERMYEGVYQYLEFFAILTDHEEWKKHMAQWEVVSELITLLRELEMAIPKSRILSAPPPPPPQPLEALSPAAPQHMNGGHTPSGVGESSASTPAPVSVERPFDVDAPVAAQNANATPAPDPSTTPYPSPPLHDEPADFEWRNLKKLCVLVLSSLTWKNRHLQDQIREHKGITALLACCAEPDEHNPYVVEHAIMCLRFALEGNETNAEIVRTIARRKQWLVDRDDPDTSALWENYVDEGPFDPELGELHVPPEILDAHG